MTTQREQSHAEWIGKPVRDDINSGSLQRIADACEKMANNVIYLQDSRQRLIKENEKLIRSNAALRRRLKRLS